MWHPPSELVEQALRRKCVKQPQDDIAIPRERALGIRVGQ
jgi:hypothetical protein